MEHSCKRQDPTPDRSYCSIGLHIRETVESINFARLHCYTRCPVGDPAATVRAERAAGRGAGCPVVAGQHGGLPLFRSVALARRLQQRRHDSVGHAAAVQPQISAGKMFAGFYTLYSSLAVVLITGITFASLVHAFLYRLRLETKNGEDDV